MTTTPPNDPRYDYRNLKPQNLSVAQLDAMWNFIMVGPPGMVGAIVSGLKILVATAYMIAREKLVAAEQDYNQQQYEQSQAAGDQGQIDKDPLGGQKKPSP